MSLLEQNTPEEIDDAARGEAFTKGSSHLILASILAAILVSVAIAVFVIVDEKPPLATGEVLEVWAHPMRGETAAFDANGEAMAHEKFEQVMIFARIRVHNQSKQPLLLNQILTNATLDDGVHSSYAAGAADYDRLFVAYPELAALRGKPLPTETTIAPGQSQEGTIVSAFRLSKQQWDARKDLSFTIGFQYQPSLVLAPKAVVTEL